MERDALLARLQRQYLEVLAPLVPQGVPVALVDFPNHANVGDSAIWWGEECLLQRLGIRPAYTCDLHTYSREALARALGEEGVILIHGGGNLGDIWPHHQAFRERVIGDFPGHVIIQLSQSVQFHSPEGLARARRVFDAHPRLTLLCRDRHSLAFVREHFRCRAELAPDAAFFLDLRPWRGVADHQVMYLARSDVEAPAASVALDGCRVLRADWLGEPRSAWIRLADALTSQLVRRPSLEPLLRRPVSRSYPRLARERVRRGCRLLSRGQVVVTDRLHAHVLALSMGIPHVFLDNNYGKNRRFFETWTHDSELTHWCDDPSQAGARVRELLG